MNDEARTPEAELASAALDGEVTPDERALVDTSPALRDEMAFYGELRSRLADVEVPSQARDSALAAALASFDEMRTVAPSAADRAGTLADAAGTSSQARSTGNVVSFRSRQRVAYRWLGGAAAAAVIAVLGIAVISKLGTGSDDKKASSATTSTVSTFKAPAADAAPSTVASAGDATLGQATAAAETTAAGTADTSAAEGVQPASTTAATEASGGGSAPAPIAFAPGGDPWAGVAPLNSTDQLIGYVTSTFRSSSDTAVSETTAGGTDSTVAEVQASTTSPPTTAAAAATTADPRTPYDLYFGCTAGLTDFHEPIILQGKRYIAVVNAATQQIDVVDPTTCLVVQSLPLG